MRITVLGEYVRAMPWSTTAWVGDLARALVARGHAVTVACDGIEDPAALSGVPVVVRRPERTLRGGDPLGFQTWSIDAARRADAEATISLSPLIAGDVWAPIGASTMAQLAPSLRAHRPVSAVLEVLARPWLPLAMAAEARARRAGRRAVCARLGCASAPAGIAALGYASRCARLDADQRREARTRVRAALEVSETRPVVLLCSVHGERPGLAPMLDGFAGLRRRWGGEPPVLLVAGRRALGVHRAAELAGMIEGVRFLGGTSRIQDVLAAADLAVAPWSATAGPSSGRFIADAVRVGTPVLAHAGSPGSEILSGGPTPAVMLAGAHQWQEAIGSRLRAIGRGDSLALDPAARDELSMDRMAARMERLVNARGKESL